MNLQLKYCKFDAQFCATMKEMYETEYLQFDLN